MITTGFLGNVAEFVNSKIAKVVLNSSYEITNFDAKQVSSGLINMQYTVPNGAITAINLIELKDNAGNVVSSNQVYVPITADTIITQTIKVKEG